MQKYRIGPNGQGTVSTSAASAVITGAGSAFDVQFQAGDALVVIPTGGGSHFELIVGSVDSPTQITATAPAPQTESGAQYYGLRLASEFCKTHGKAFDPKGVPAPGGESVITGAGVEVWRGSEQSQWEWAGMPVAQRTALKVYAFGNRKTLSGSCWVETPDEDDVWQVWRAVGRLAPASQLERNDGHYVGVGLLLLLVEAAL